METGVGLEEPDGGAAVPESETVDLVRGFHVWHAELQHSACAVAADRRRNHEQLASWLHGWPSDNSHRF
jgi:hypothetical protein